MIKYWLGREDLDPRNWQHFNYGDTWWTEAVNRNGRAFVVYRNFARVWTERNARIFRNFATLPTVIFDNIKIEPNLWWTTGLSI